MKRFLLISSLLVVLAITVTACGSSEPNVEPQVQVEQPLEAASETIDESAVSDESQVEQPSQPDQSFPNWYNAALTDVNTGGVFTVKDNIRSFDIDGRGVEPLRKSKLAFDQENGTYAICTKKVVEEEDEYGRI